MLNFNKTKATDVNITTTDAGINNSYAPLILRTPLLPSLKKNAIHSYKRVDVPTSTPKPVTIVPFAGNLWPYRMTAVHSCRDRLNITAES